MRIPLFLFTFQKAAIVQKCILKAPEHWGVLLYFPFPAPQWISSNKLSPSSRGLGIMGFAAWVCFFSSSPNLCFLSLWCVWDSSPGLSLGGVNGTGFSSVTDGDLRCRDSGPDLLRRFAYSSPVSLSPGRGDPHWWWLRGVCPHLHHCNLMTKFNTIL